ncbi:thymic stromal cotransporter homolog [Spea bombifrons]|uniref:thymic stromal cotransporter homolog n=1 Tax=Spea bombifrons TaxID=233779 RepID=UPI00234BBC50|nr:thymic stromal cotransporter homolog [Spea bombifrons]
MMNLRTRIEPVVVLAKVASSFYDIGLDIAAGNHSDQNTSSTNSTESNSDFHFAYKTVTSCSCLLAMFILEKIIENINRKIPICVPLVGSLISSILLLFVTVWNWPKEVMFGAAILNGLSGWFSLFWSGVITWVSHASSDSSRSLQLTLIHMTYGLAGLIGTFTTACGLNRLNFTDFYQGVIAACCSITCYTFCILYIIFVLRIPESGVVHDEESKENSTIETKDQNIYPEDAEESGMLVREDETQDTEPNFMLIAVLLCSAAFYHFAFTGAHTVIELLVTQKLVLHCIPPEVWVCITHITSTLGIFILARWANDSFFILLGMCSFCAGILIMAFVKWTFLYHIGKIFTASEIVMEILEIASSALITKMYEPMAHGHTLFYCIVFFGLGLLCILLISVSACKNRLQYQHQAKEESEICPLWFCDP